MTSPADPWRKNAAQWHRIGPPLRPVADDLAIVEEAAEEWRAAHAGRPLRALILGVTPELCTLPWPAGTALVAVDRSPDMIREVWPETGLPKGASAIAADWRDLPFPDGAFDLIAGDGCYSLLPFPDDYRIFGTEMRRVLAPEGRFLMRAFVQPAKRESADAVGEALWSGRIGSFHAFKWRLAMSLQPSTAQGVRLADVWDAWHSICPDPAALGERLGWPLDTITTIDAYRGAPAHYNFPSVAELRAILAGHFIEIACHTPSYELGDRCPTLVARRKDS
ncbi:MAG: class I SAM-dependent methyltransferase [Byssovorax sp.]